MSKTLKFQDRVVPVPGLGTMSLSGVYGHADDGESEKVLKAALDLGCTFWDTAVAYGEGENERMLGEFLKANPGSREKVLLASKCGLEIHNRVPGTDMKITNSAEHIAQYIEETRERLGSYPDLYYLHRIDVDTPVEESIPALQKLKDDGKVKYIGLSECSAATLRKACKIAHIDALQIEYSPFELGSEHNGLMEAARELGVSVVAYSPLGRGMLTGAIRRYEDLPKGDFRRYLPQWSPENLDYNLAIADKFIAIAKAKGCPPSQLVLAWVAEQGVIPIFGTRSPARVEENFGASNVTLSPDELASINKIIEENKPQGLRYPEKMMSRLGN